MSDNNTFSIRPAGRHLLTIGRDLIKDKYAAIVELVKNSYDAGSPDVRISFIVSDARDTFQIVVEDHGHGMSREDVINKWLVPSTADKLDRRSYKNRTMQGRKGIGRWSAAVLGNDLFLESTTPTGEMTEVFIEWSEFENTDYLDQVPILVETKSTQKSQGTILTITSTPDEIEYWLRSVDEKNKASGFALLEYELSKLVSPFSFSFDGEDAGDEFDIVVDYGNLFENENKEPVTIQPIPIIDAFDYSITGKVLRGGTGNLTYQIQKARNTVTEELILNLGEETGCGDLNFDIRVFDRDADSVSQLIQRSDAFKHADGSLFGKREARNLLNDYNGIGVYRNGFRIRPLGDPEFDWLALNKRRVQEPSRSIGSDQVIGYIQIQSEEISCLEEKAARDGLKENEAFDRLKEIILNTVLPELEIRRFEFRRNADAGRQKNRIESNILKLDLFGELDKELAQVLDSSKVSADVVEEVSSIVKEQGRQHEKIIEDIKEAIAVYQGQATLGKIVNVVLHEGRKPIGYFVNTYPLMQKWLKQVTEKPEEELVLKFNKALETAHFNAKMLAGFYKQIDPLASVQRGRKSLVSVKSAIELAHKTLHGEMELNSISFESVGEDSKLECWAQDLQIIFTNLFENSIFWLSSADDADERSISVDICSENGVLEYISIIDSGPGIESKHIDSEIIFEPGFSTKPKGTGLGLAIAGEAAERCKLDLIAIESSKGSHFQLKVREDTDEL